MQNTAQFGAQIYITTQPRFYCLSALIRVLIDTIVSLSLSGTLWLWYNFNRHAGLELSGVGGVEPPVHVYRGSFLSENRP